MTDQDTANEFWALAKVKPLIAMQSELFPILTLAEPERWIALEAEHSIEWIAGYAHKLPTHVQYEFIADCAERVLHLYSDTYTDNIEKLAYRTLRDRQTKAPCWKFWHKWSWKTPTLVKLHTVTLAQRDAEEHQMLQAWRDRAHSVPDGQTVLEQIAGQANQNRLALKVFWGLAYALGIRGNSGEIEDVLDMFRIAANETVAEVLWNKAPSVSETVWQWRHLLTLLDKHRIPWKTIT